MPRYAVIFDMDGVLVDSYRPHFQSWQMLAAENGLSISQEQFAATFGRTSREIIRTLWPEHVTDEQQVAAWDARKEAIYRELLERDFPEMDGAGKLLTDLHAAGFALAIGSSGPPENLQAALKGLTGAERISATVNGHEVTHGKPDPEVFLLAARRLGVQPHRCAVIEDAPAGIDAARRAGMAAIAITGTAERKKLARADLIVDSLRELSPGMIRELIDRRPTDAQPPLQDGN